MRQTNFARYNVSTTIMIETPSGSVGTGFIVAFGHHVQPDNPYVAFVTNKHVLDLDKASRRLGKRLTIHADVTTTTGPRPERVDVDYAPEGYREHPSDDVDVCAFLPRFVGQERFFMNRAVRYDEIANRDLVVQYGISPGDDVLTVGYPLRYLQGQTNAPLVRHGTIATSLLQDLSGLAVGLRGILPAFLFDGGTLPGSSGSPVFLKPTTGRIVDNEIQVDPPPPILIGIVAETRLAPVPGTAQMSYAGLGMAFRGETIRDTLDLFLP
jgi:hypothetical protein